MNQKGYCQKDNKEVDLARGCCHPGDYCQFRTACVVHFFEQEREREEKKKRERGSEDTSYK